MSTGNCKNTKNDKRRLRERMRDEWIAFEYSTAGEVVGYLLMLLIGGAGVGAGVCVALRVAFWLAPLMGLPLKGV